MEVPHQIRIHTNCIIPYFSPNKPFCISLMFNVMDLHGLSLQNAILMPRATSASNLSAMQRNGLTVNQKCDFWQDGGGRTQAKASVRVGNVTPSTTPRPVKYISWRMHNRETLQFCCLNNSFHIFFCAALCHVTATHTHCPKIREIYYP